MRLRIVLLTLVLPLFVQTLAAGPIIEASANFSGGVNGRWDFAFTSGPAGLYLERITIDLSPTSVRFDTAPGGFGSLTSLDVGAYQGTDTNTGLYQILPGTGAALDGGALVTFLFNDFTVGEAFHFTADVDNPDPVLATCTGSLGARLACAANNAALRTAASIVTPAQFNGALVTYTFGGPGFYTGEFTTAFAPDGGLRIFGSATGLQDELTPEPATYVSLAAGLLLVGFRLRRRASR